MDYLQLKYDAVSPKNYMKFEKKFSNALVDGGLKATMKRQ